MTQTAYRPYTGTRRLTSSPTQPAQTYRAPTGDQGNPHDPAYPWYHAVPTLGPPTADPRYPPGGGPGGGGGGGGNGGGGSTDPYADDPVYQQIVAMQNNNVAQAQASATAARKQLAIELGDPALAMKLGLGQNIADTAQANPFSTLKNLLRGHNSNVTGIDQGTNHANLFYSSTRAHDLQGEQTGYQGNISGAEGNAQRQLAQIAAALLAAEQAAAAARAAAAGEAYDRRKNQPGDPGALALYQLRHIGSATGPDDTSDLTPATILRLLGG